MSAKTSQVGGDHYRALPVQPVEFIHRNEIGFIEGNIIKYVVRHKRKNGKLDLEKARHYLDMLIEMDYPEDAEECSACGMKCPPLFGGCLESCCPFKREQSP